MPTCVFIAGTPWPRRPHFPSASPAGVRGPTWPLPCNLRRLDPSPEAHSLLQALRSPGKVGWGQGSGGCQALLLTQALRSRASLGGWGRRPGLSARGSPLLRLLGGVPQMRCCGQEACFSQFWELRSPRWSCADSASGEGPLPGSQMPFSPGPPWWRGRARSLGSLIKALVPIIRALL